MSELEKILNIALNEVGYLEKKSNRDLDDKTKNSGKNDYTKYSRDIDKITTFYNGKKQGAAWCDIFVDWCFITAFGVDRAKILLNQPDKSLGAGCKFSASYYKKNNSFYNEPNLGDQIFFKNDNGAVVHTGLVYNIDKNYVYTVEGNASNSVKKRKYLLTDKTIYGYGRPKYQSSLKEKEKTVESEVSTKKYIQITAKEGVWCRKGIGFTYKKYKAIPYNTKCELLQRSVKKANGYYWDKIKYSADIVYLPNNWNKYL